MSMRRLVEADCGGANPLMQMGGQFTKDAAHQDAGLRQEHRSPNEGFVSEFLGQAGAPPQSFQMNNLLQEMREIESRNFHSAVVSGPKVIDQVADDQWAKEYAKMSSVPIISQQPNFNEAWKQTQPTPGYQSTSDFFGPQTAGPSTSAFQPMMPLMHNVYPHQQMPMFDQHMQRQLEPIAAPQQGQNLENWFDDFEKSKVEEAQKTENYNDQFWEKLHNEWQKMAEDGDADHPWLSEFSDLYDPYKEYTFQENNVMDNIENALERGKEFLKKGDLPTAALCFEVAAKQQPENPEVWELLGITQAENEMDPLAIAALKKSLDLQPDNLKVLMALAVSYTNESLQSQALKMMSLWLQNNPKYKALVNPSDIQNTEDIASSLIRAHDLKEVQNMFLDVVQKTPNQVDPDIQEALGVLFNLSSEYDKAVDCFQAALQMAPENAKLWNRLGASLANGSRSVEAVEAYQRALELEPGFIRVRYNVGICCMNLKAYKEAADHLLTALNLQATSSERSGLDVTKDKKQQMSDTIWSTLKMIISLMGRNDLHDLINNRDVEQLNKAFEF